MNVCYWFGCFPLLSIVFFYYRYPPRYQITLGTSPPSNKQNRNQPIKQQQSNSGSNNNNNSLIGYSPQHPFYARMIENTRLTSPDWEQDVRHIVLDISDSTIQYEPGDVVNILPRYR